MVHQGCVDDVTAQYISAAKRTGGAWSGLARVVLPQLRLDSGEVLSPVRIAYESWGRLSPARDNVILVCHALTGDAHACDSYAPDDARAGWWNPLIGPGRVFDTNRYFVICSNVLGSCYGSSGPTSPHPVDGAPWRLRFPLVTVRDIVRAQWHLLQSLDIPGLAAVAGGSLGGLQALEWAIAYPDSVEKAIVVAASARLSAQGLAIDEIARQSIMGDPKWNGGQYTDASGPETGLALARMLAMLTYTSAEGLEARFGRRAAVRDENWPVFGQRHDVHTYLHHQADKLVRRFDANSYLYLSHAMDQYDASSDIHPGRSGTRFSAVRARVLTVGIRSDWLYPPSQVRALAQDLAAAGASATYVELDSPHGHDAFLKEWDQMDAVLRPFLG